MAEIFIGNVKGPQGDTGATGATGAQGEAATIAVGNVTTVPYGQNARVVNSGTAEEAVFDFVIPQGRPGEQTTKLDNLTIDAITEPSTTFPTPAVGDSGSTLFGKISKWFSDMTALVATKLNATSVVNNQTTTNSGYALDARQANPNISGSIASQIPRMTNGVPYVIEGRSVTIEFTDGIGTITFQHSFTNVLSVVATTVGAAVNTAAFVKVKATTSTSVTLICNNISSGSSTLNPGSGNININYIVIGY